MAFEGGNIIRERVKKYGIQCNQKDGGVFAAFSDKQMHELERHKQVWAEYGKPDMQMVGKSELHKIVNTDAYVGGMIDPHGGQIHPLNLAQGEAMAIESLGGKIYEDSPVIRIDRGETVVVHTATGCVKAKFAMVAGNAYLGNLVPELAAKSMPCGSQICTTEVLGKERAAELIPSDLCVEDCNYKLDYYRITDDHRLLFGGGVTYGGGDPASIEGYLRPHFEQIFPSLKNVKVEYTWGGNFLLTLTRIPQFGRIGNNIYYAQGYSGHGVTTTHLAGKLIAEAMKGQAERFDAFAKLPHYYFPGGRLFRVPYTVMGSWYYGLRDKLGI
jgi:gamma-glutamylputrescine oxidase